jgi:phosphoribosylformylglycinamidine synthase
MKNDFRGTKRGQPVKISVLPTVLVTALGRIANLAHARTSEFKSAGDLVFLIGPHRFSHLGSQLERIGMKHAEARDLPLADWPVAKKLYTWLGSEKSARLRSCADVSEGGMLTAIAEGLFAYQLGFEMEAKSPFTLTDYFGEGFHSFIVSVSPTDENAITQDWFQDGITFKKLGKLTDHATLKLPHTEIPLTDVEKAWRSR